MFNLLLRTIRRDLVRLIGVLILANLAIQALAWLYPAQREIALASASHAAWTTWTPIQFSSAELNRIRTDFGQDVFTTAEWEAGLEKPSGEEFPVAILATATPESLASFYPAATLLDHRDVTGTWVDIDADTATGTGLRAGDTATVLMGESVSLHATVRSVYAVSINSAMPTVMMPLTQLLEVRPDLAEEKDQYLILTTKLDPGQTQQTLAQPIYLNSLIDDGYFADGENPDWETLEILSPQQWYTAIEAGLETNLSIILVVSTLSALALAGLTVRELVVFTKRTTQHCTTLYRLGYPQQKFHWWCSGWATVGSVLGITAGATVAVWVLNSRILNVVFPPTLLPAFWAVTTAVAVFAGAVILASGWWRARRFPR